ncbi:hypothetical protein SAMN03159496_04675 [Rhizobium sp. NFR07]|uniref:hypothetical protein n=1 Tax=Rhizobium sp. NFR07 TaxID=1566262 RepID=UPI0008ED6754|nr:hypothetical protein [Rhizobium sp. NFR07]SFB52643.1 hypothetical protein SAMN03159496_04675 [Rhizobium sp. NFR07]
MSTIDDNQCDCTYFDEGDWVESKLNTDIIGIVVSNSDFGRYVNVQLAGSLEVRPFFAVTLRHAERADPPAKAEEPPTAVIINFENYLRGAKPQGRA